MGFFSDICRVKADHQRGLLRVSIRMSEESIFEYWLSPQSLIPFVKASDYREWQGNEIFKAKINGRDATICVKTSEGASYFKMRDSHLWVLRAQVEAACFEFGDIAKEYRPTGTPSHITLGIVAQMQETFQKQLLQSVSEMMAGHFSQLSQLIDNKLSNIEVKSHQDQPHTPQFSPSDAGVFIPSNLINKDVTGVAKATEGESENNVSDALSALKKLKKENQK